MKTAGAVLQAQVRELFKSIVRELGLYIRGRLVSSLGRRTGNASASQTGRLQLPKESRQISRRGRRILGILGYQPHKPAKNEYESCGLVEDDWETVRWNHRMDDLAKLRLNNMDEMATVTLYHKNNQQV